MATRVVCDVCGGPVDEHEFVQFEGNPSKVQIPLARRFANFDVCKYCMLDKFATLDDRQKPMAVTAVPREPTGAMVLAALDAGYHRGPGAMWRVMFDEFNKQEKTDGRSTE